MEKYELIVEHRGGYLYAHVIGGSARPTAARAYLGEISRKCNETDCDRVVIENDSSAAFQVWDILPVAKQFPMFGLDCTKVAVVDHVANHIEKTEFTVKVGRECGIELHVFEDVAEAVSWVLAV